jgi:hypothetical protein
VFECLVRLADHQKMAWTSIATTLQQAERDGKTEVEALELVQTKLRKLLAVTQSLKPSPQTDFAKWKLQIISRLTDFLDIVLRPKIVVLRGGCATRIGILEKEENEIKFLYEAIQLERHVPLVRYGIFPDPYLTLSDGLWIAGSLQVCPTMDEAVVAQECDLERSYSAASLKTEVRILRAKVMQLEADKKRLIAEKEQHFQFNRTLGSEFHHGFLARNSDEWNNRDVQNPVRFSRRQTILSVPTVLRQFPQQQAAPRPTPMTIPSEESSAEVDEAPCLIEDSALTHLSTINPVMSLGPPPASPILSNGPLSRGNGVINSCEIANPADIDVSSFGLASTLQDSFRNSESSLVMGLYPSTSTPVGFGGLPRSIGTMDLVAAAGLEGDSLASLANVASSFHSGEDTLPAPSIGGPVLGNINAPKSK